MHLVIFGLGMSSSWGNGHATLWRGMVKALGRRGHTVTFYEKDVPYYAATRDGWEAPRGVQLRLYSEFSEIRGEAERDLAHADLGMTTSYCADGRTAARTLLDSSAGIKGFYDLDTPVTLRNLHCGSDVPYVPLDGLSAFDVVLSYTGGRALEELTTRLGARWAVPLYGWVDGETHFPAAAREEFRAELSYLGTYAADRQAALNTLFVETAKTMPLQRFAIGGAQYPEDFPWTPNIFFVRHLPPALHAAFFCSGRATLNVTRQAMAQYGFCPSGRLFEAAACGTPLLSDVWDGLETFFTAGAEILPVRNTADVREALSLSDGELQRIGAAARERTLQHHTAEQRVIELEGICERAGLNARQPALAR